MNAGRWLDLNPLAGTANLVRGWEVAVGEKGSGRRQGKIGKAQRYESV